MKVGEWEVGGEAKGKRSSMHAGNYIIYLNRWRPASA